jgi:hypothetical protein
MAAGYDMYELLETIIRQVAWRNMAEMQAALASVAAARDCNLFGNMALMISCQHSRLKTAGLGLWKCLECDRMISN